MEEVIYTDGKKYKTVNNNGILTVYRNEELWMNKELIGNKYVLSLVQRIIELEEENLRLKNLENKKVQEDIKNVKVWEYDWMYP